MTIKHPMVCVCCNRRLGWKIFPKDDNREYECKACGYVTYKIGGEI